MIGLVFISALVFSFAVFSVPMASAQVPMGSFDRNKGLEVSSAPGSPTVSKAQPIYVVGGDEMTTGSGDIVLDWKNINSKSDIAVYDQNGNLLPYEIESFNASSKTAIIWVYNDWVRDSSVQARIAYGAGPLDSQENVSGTWNNPGQNAAMVQHLQDDPLTATDSSPNGNDGTVNGATATSGGQLNGAASFDGTGDGIVSDGAAPNSGVDRTVVAWFQPDIIGGNPNFQFIFGPSSNDTGYNLNLEMDSTGHARMHYYDGSNQNATSSTTLTTGTFYSLTGRWDESANEASIYVDGNHEDSSLGGEPGYHTDLNIGIKNHNSPTGDEEEAEGDIDEARFYTELKSDAWIQSDYDASSKGGKSFFVQNAPPGGFDRIEDVKVSPVSGSPTVSKAQPIEFTYGDISSTGFGDIVLSWTNISSKSDIAIYDEDNNLLPYEFENFDNQYAYAILWVYNDWVRDNTVQARIAYGDGPTKSQENVYETWSNPGQNAVMVQHLENDPLVANDSSPNNNDGTITGAKTTFGQFYRAARFDNSDGIVSSGAAPDVIDDMTLTAWFRPENYIDNEFIFGPSSNDGTHNLSLWMDNSGKAKMNYWDGSHVDAHSDTVMATGNSYSLMGMWDNSVNKASIYVDGTLENENTGGDPPQTHSDLNIGIKNINNLDGPNANGVIDEARFYKDLKGDSWAKAEYDASPKAGQKFFYQTPDDGSDGSGGSDGTVGGKFVSNNPFSSIVVYISLSSVVILLFLDLLRRKRSEGN